MVGSALAQPAQGERRAGTIAQQPRAPGTVSGRDAHRAVDGEAAAVSPLRHRLPGIALSPAVVQHDLV
jgi:hypothetical protein